MPKFRKKPVEIEAVRWNGSTCGLTNGAEPLDRDVLRHGIGNKRLEMPSWMPPVSRIVTEEKWPGSVPAGEVWRDGDDLWIGTLEGPHKASPGDWIIQGVKGELYPCKPDIFAMTYDPA